MKLADLEIGHIGHLQLQKFELIRPLCNGIITQGRRGHIGVFHVFHVNRSVNTYFCYIEKLPIQ